MTAVTLTTEEKPNIQAEATAITIDMGEKQNKEAPRFITPNQCLTDEEPFKFRFPAQQRPQVRYVIAVSFIYLGIFCALTVFMIILSIILEAGVYCSDTTHSMAGAIIALGVFLIVRLVLSIATKSIYLPAPLVIVPVFLDAAMLVTFIVITVLDYVQLSYIGVYEHHPYQGSCDVAYWFAFVWTTLFWLLGTPVIGYFVIYSNMIWYTRDFCVNLYRQIEDFASQTFLFEDETTQPAPPTQPMPAN